MLSQEMPFSINSILTLDFKDSKVCEFAYNSFLPEFNRSKTKRSHVTMDKIENCLRFEIECQDITAFRATISDIIALGKILENTIELTK